MSINENQRYSIVAGAIIAALALMYVPWVGRDHGEHGNFREEEIGYALLFAPPQRGKYSETAVVYSRVVLTVAIVAAGTLGAVFVCRKPECSAKAEAAAE